ncbi:SCO family protein [Verrucomicrobiales bacterium]|nr:SCO family protein [Verrucomicrobiales bacterium]MDB4808994.1 SCO family protein [Verrucomicrobiales bacterium]
MSTNEQTPRTGQSLVLVILSVVIVLALVIFWNVRQLRRGQQSAGQQLPVIAQLDIPLEGLNHRGEDVSFADLRGKVWVLAYFYTKCPSGCEGVMGRMKDLQTEFSHEADRLHFVGLSMDPNNDTPEQMATWGKDKDRGMGSGNWWFMTGDTGEVRNYMSKHLRMNVTTRTDPAEITAYGELEHEFKLVLVDQEGAVRYYYDVLGGQTGDVHAAKIREDIQYLLEQS